MSTERKSVERILGLPEPVRAQILEETAKHPLVEQVLLYGSRGQNDSQSRSDIHFSVDVREASTSEWLRIVDGLQQELKTLLLADVGKRSDAPEALREV